MALMTLSLIMKFCQTITQFTIEITILEVVGWVLLAIRECKLLLTPDNSKVITVQLCAPKPVVLCTAYLPPHSTLADAQPLFDHLSSVCSGTMPVIAIGDYNLPGIDWETLSGDSLISNTFCDLVFDLNLTQLMGSPSHISGPITHK